MLAVTLFSLPKTTLRAPHLTTTTRGRTVNGVNHTWVISVKTSTFDTRVKNGVCIIKPPRWGTKMLYSIWFCVIIKTRTDFQGSKLTTFLQLAKVSSLVLYVSLFWRHSRVSFRVVGIASVGCRIAQRWILSAWLMGTVWAKCGS